MKSKKSILFIILFLLASIGYFLYNNNNFSFALEDGSSKFSEDINEELEVYFLDVGQADSILIRNKDKNMLIDAGNNNDGDYLVSYFKSIGIEKFDYVVGTHAHEDHIGGMDNIIDNFGIGKFYMPDKITTTKTFRDVLDALERKQIKFNVPEIGDVLNFGDVNIRVIYISSDDELNDTSIVLKLVYKDISMLFMGDASTKVEEKILLQDLKSDVLKVGHHGSIYSTSEDFIKKVEPKISIIEVGKNNNYGHPRYEVIERLKNIGSKVYRTDEDGTIKVSSDGEKLKVEFLNTNTDGGSK